MRFLERQVRGTATSRALAFVLSGALASGVATVAHGGAPTCAPMVLIAHRGIASPSAENTLAAFEEAHRLGYGVVETDVRISADDSFVLMHDRTLRRTAGRPESVVHLRSHELRMISTRAGQPIPGLDRALRWAQTRRMRMVLHLKDAAERRWTASRLSRLRRLVQRSGMSDQVTYLSARPRLLRTIELFDGSARTAWLAGGRPTVAAARQHADQVFVPASVADAPYVRAMHRADVQVNAAKAERPEELAALVRAGVVRAVTDELRPGVARDLSRLTRSCADVPTWKR